MNTMIYKHLFLNCILLCIVLTTLIFIAFYVRERGDMNVVVFGTILYFPYVLALSGLNFLLFGIGLKKINKRPDVFLTAFFTNMVLAISYLLNGNQIRIRYWDLSDTEFIILNLVIFALNLLTVNHLTRENKWKRLEQK